jgi:hypothetical protein
MLPDIHNHKLQFHSVNRLHVSTWNRTSSGLYSQEHGRISVMLSILD